MRSELISQHPAIMGILNVTPDSFSDGGSYKTVGDALSRIEEMIGEGAQIIDIGGESTRPNGDPVDAETEWARVCEVLGRAAELGVKISIDTRKPSVAKLALERGASVVNDVCAFEHLGEIIALAKSYDAELIVMHNARSKPPSGDIIADISASFYLAVAAANEYGFYRKNLILDVGIGFGTTPAQDIEIIARLGELTARFSERILIGASRKSFMRIFGEMTPADRLPCTLATTMAAYLGGCSIFRVHDVRANFDLLNFAGAAYGR